MILWRVSEHAALDGAGGLFSGGRWHSLGSPVIYTAESAALALLEALVQFQPRAALPSRYQLLRISVPDNLAIASWDEGLPVEHESVKWGDRWLQGRETLLARVPAAVAPYSSNWLVNPVHPEAHRVRLLDAGHWTWDARLFA